MYETIRRAYKERIQIAWLSIEWQEGIYPSKFSLSDFKTCLSSLEPRYHAALVDLLWKREDIFKKDKMIFLVDVLNTSNSLNAKDYAGKLLANEMGLKWDPFMYIPLLENWEKIKDTIK